MRRSPEINEVEVVLILCIKHQAEHPRLRRARKPSLVEKLSRYHVIPVLDSLLVHRLAKATVRPGAVFRIQAIILAADLVVRLAVVKRERIGRYRRDIEFFEANYVPLPGGNDDSPTTNWGEMWSENEDLDSIQVDLSLAVPNMNLQGNKMLNVTKDVQNSMCCTTIS